MPEPEQDIVYLPIRLITRVRDDEGRVVGEVVSVVDTLPWGHRYLYLKDGSVVDIDS